MVLVVVYSQMFHVGQLSKIPDVLFFRIFISVLGLVMVVLVYRYSQMFYVEVSKIPDVFILRIFIGVLG